MLFSILSAVSLAVSLAVAQDGVIENLSFGHKNGGLSPNSFNIPGWAMLGEGHIPQLMSDKVILTPPYGGGKRGAIWSDAKMQSNDWAVTLEFRASGDHNGKGNLQMWYVQDGKDKVTTASIYTAGKFDGLAIVVDTNGGMQKIRGFLSDGTIDYKNHPNVDSLAFGHCDYSYRNLGRPSKLQVRSTSAGLEVAIDGQQCFTTNKVKLPTEYNFGVTAASSDPPDSFEVFKFETRVEQTGMKNIADPVLVDQQAMKSSQSAEQGSSGASGSADVQFQDLNNRINQLSKSISNMFAEINQHTKAEEQRYQEIIRLLSSGSGTGNVDSRLSTIDRTVNELANELKGGNHKEQFAKISAQLQETNRGLTHHLPGKMREYVQNHTPRIGFIVFSFMAFQSCCLAVLLWQKWRKNTMPKKFL